MKKYASRYRTFQSSVSLSPVTTYDQAGLVTIYASQSACSFVAERYLPSTGTDRNYVYDYRIQNQFPPPFPYQTSILLGPVYRIADLKFSKDSKTPFHIYPLFNNYQKHLPDQNQVTLNFLKRYFNQPTVLYDAVQNQNVVIDVPVDIWKVKTIQNWFVTVSILKTFELGKGMVIRENANDTSELFNHIRFVFPNGTFIPFLLYMEHGCPDLFVDSNTYVSKTVLEAIRDQLSNQITNSQLATAEGVQILSF